MLRLDYNCLVIQIKLGVDTIDFELVLTIYKMEKEISYAVVLLLMCLTGISANVVIVRPVNKTIYIFERTDIVFECHHPPNESVEWYKSGMRILNTTFDAKRFNIETDDRRTADGEVVSRLKVSSISRTEGGSYKCSNADLEKALFEEGQTDEVHVFVIRVDAAIRIAGPANDTVTEGEDLLLVCSGDISADLAWYFKSELLVRDPFGSVIITEEENTEIRIRRLALTRSKATPDYEGPYTCYDQINRKEGTVIIKVAETGNVVIVRPVNKTITVTEGSKVVIECHHPPSESVEWFRSGLSITNASFDPKRFSIRTEGKTISLLTISSINRTESGVYKCSNANLEKAFFGNGQTDIANVRVIRLKAVVQIEGPTNGIVTEGQNLLLICAGDITSELIWYFKEARLEPGLNGQPIITPEENQELGYRRSALTRSMVTADHEGQYNCYDQVNFKHASIFIRVAPSDGSMKVQYSSTLLAMTFFTAAVALAISV